MIYTELGFKKNLMSRIISTFFGLGYFPVAPGTFTSLAVILLYKFFLSGLRWPVYLVVLLIFFFAGVVSSSRHSARLEERDPSCIVVDEVGGQLLVLFRLNPSWFLLALGFFLFRFFDIIKPYPIRKIETIPKGWGIMLDDILAAVYAGILIQVYLLLK